MKHRRLVVKLSAAAVGVLGVLGAVAPAQAEPDPSMPVGPSILDQLVTSTPALQVMPATAENSDSPRDRFGMVCENLTARCR